MAYTSWVNQIATVVDSVYGQAIGSTNLTSANTADLVSMGDVVLSSSQNKEQFYNVLMQRVGKVLSLAENWVIKKRGIYKNVLDFGNALQMIAFEAGSSSNDNAWLGVDSWENTTRGTQNNPFTNTVNTTAMQYIFNGYSAYSYKDVIPTIQIKGSFTSTEAMAAFIGGIYQTHKNKLAQDAEAIGNVVVGRAMYECYKKANANSGANTALFRNLLAEYNKDVLGLSDPTISSNALVYPSGWVKAADALANIGFMTYFVEQLQLIVSHMSDPTQAFNIAGHTTQCLDPSIEVLEGVAKKVSTVFANTYHNELLSLPGFDSRNFWQSSKKSGATTYGFEATSSVSIGVKVSNAAKTFAASGIIAMVYDPRAIMQTVEDYRSYSLFNPDDEVLNTYDKANMHYAIVACLDMVCFQIADPTIESNAVALHKYGYATVA